MAASNPIRLVRQGHPDLSAGRRAVRLLLGRPRDREFAEAHAWHPGDSPGPGEIAALRELGVTEVPETWLEARHLLLRLTKGGGDFPATASEEPGVPEAPGSTMYPGATGATTVGEPGDERGSD